MDVLNEYTQISFASMSIRFDSKKKHKRRFVPVPTLSVRHHLVCFIGFE